MKPLTEPIDMFRWWAAFAQVCAVSKEVLAHPECHTLDEVNAAWEWVRQHYGYSLAAYSEMTPQQQAVVKEPLEGLRVKLERLSH